MADIEHHMRCGRLFRFGTNVTLPKLKTWFWSHREYFKPKDPASVFIAACAFFLSIQQACSQRDLLKLQAYPRLSATFDYNETGAGFLFGNAGTGYAELKTFEVLVNGKPVYNWDHMLTELHYKGGVKRRFTVPRPGVILKQDTISQIFWVTPPDHAELFPAIDKHVVLKACYRSMFDEYFTWSWPSNAVQKVPAYPWFLTWFQDPPCPAPAVSFDAPPYNGIIPRK